MTNERLRQLKGNIPKLYVMHVLGHAQFHLAINALFLLQKGFTTREFFLAQSAQALAVLLMEIPTGVLSDRLSRRWSLVAASLVGLPTIPIVILSDSFPVVLVAMVASGVAGALASGTDVALAYDTLLALGREDDFQRVQGRIAWYRSISMAVAGIIGGLMAQFDMALAWWAFFVASALAVPVRLSLAEPPFRGTAQDESYASHLRQSLAISFSGAAGYFVLYAAVIWLFFRLGFWLWQPYLDSIAVPVAVFGIVYATANLVHGIVARQAHSLEKRMGTRISLLLVPALLAAALMMQSQAKSLIGSALIMVHAGASGAFSVLTESYINRRVPSSRRATVLSIKNMLNSVLFVVLAPLLGRMVDTNSLSSALLILGASLAVVLSVFFAWYGRRSLRSCTPPR